MYVLFVGWWVFLPAYVQQMLHTSHVPLTLTLQIKEDEEEAAADAPESRFQKKGKQAEKSQVISQTELLTLTSGGKSQGALESVTWFTQIEVMSDTLA